MIELINERIAEKGWGYEKILHNRADYCAKILHFNKGGRCSLHYHLLKSETHYVAKGEFDLYYYDTDNAELKVMRLIEGMIIDIEKGSPHQLVAITEGEIFEASTMHYDYDNYRIVKGDSQK
jgi:mannose-6-phosphate isomerase-like protein (cupin superfamily)